MYTTLLKKRRSPLSILCCTLLGTSFFYTPLTHAATSSSGYTSSSGRSSSNSSGNLSGYTSSTSSSGYYGYTSSSSSSSGGVITGSCETKTLYNGDSSSEGAVGSILDGDCSQADGQGLVDRYTITLKPGQRIAFYEHSGNVPMHISLLDAQGVVRGDASGYMAVIPSKGSMLDLDAGTYTLEVSFVDPAIRGDYFVQVITSNPDTAFINQELLAARCAQSWQLLPTEGELYLPISCSNGSLGTNHYYLHFSIDLTETSEIALSMLSPDFSPQLSIWNEAGELIRQQKSEPNKPLMIPAEQYLSLPAGKYALELTTAQPYTWGSFYMKYENITWQNSSTSSSSSSSSSNSSSSSGWWASSSSSTSSGGWGNSTSSSSGWAASSSGWAASSTSSSGFPGSSTSTSSSSSSGNSTTSSSTSTSSSGAPSCNQRLQLNTSVHGELHSGPCLMGPSEDLRSFQNYQVYLTPDQPVVFSLQANFDSVLSLKDARGRTLLTNNGEGNGARIPTSGSYTVKKAGNYLLQVTTKEVRTLGSFQLEAKSAADPCAVIKPLASGVHVTGALEKSHCQTSKSGHYIDRYSFKGLAKAQVMLELDAKFPSKLTLRGPDGKVVASDDTSIPSKGFLKLPKGAGGEYTVEVSSSKPATGGYVLQFRQRN